MHVIGRGWLKDVDDWSQVTQDTTLATHRKAGAQDQWLAELLRTIDIVSLTCCEVNLIVRLFSSWSHHVALRHIHTHI